MIISDETINQVKERTNIVEVIGEYVNLKASGSNYKGLCPFHSEKTPSFMVSPNKGIFHCFGCGVGGNVFSFLMKFKGVTFPDAVRLLGERVGIQIRDSSIDRKKISRLERTYELNKEALKIFERNLFSENGKSAMEYLSGRNLDLETIKLFHIGFALNSWDSILTSLGAKGYSNELIEESGLIVKKKKGNGFYDRFRNRIIFPIQDSIERVIGFGGRTFINDNADVPKYINTNENAIFHKGRHLYGFYNAQEFIRRKDSVIIVEGYMDVLRMFKEGLKNTVAPLGTALTEDQISLIMRYTRNIYLAFDPDEAGKKAMIRSISLMHKWGVDPSIILLPSGKDPGDFFDDYTVDEFQLLIDDAAMGNTFIVYSSVNSKKEYSANEKITLLQDLVEYYDNIKDEILKDEFIHTISTALKIKEGLLVQEFEKLTTRKLVSFPRSEKSEKKISNNEKSDRGISVEQYLLLLLLSNPDLLPIAESRLDESYFRGKWTRKLWKAICRASDNKNWNSGTVFDYLENEKYIEYLSGKIIGNHLNINPEGQIIDVVSNLKEKRIRERIERINSRLRKATFENNDVLANELIMEKQVCRSELEKLKLLRSSKSPL